MTTVSMNPLTDQIKDQNHLFVPPGTQDSSSLSCCSSFSNIQYDQIEKIGGLRHDQEDQKPVILHGRSNSGQVSPTSAQPIKDDPNNNVHGRNSSICKTEGEEVIRSSNRSTKWMSSKMRLMRKIMIPNDPEASNMDHNQRQENSQRSPSNNYTTTRVCADCNTTTTPLWRSGPKGPKSLCNACGIRQRKARRAMAEAAANGLAMDATSTKTKIYNKEKKQSINHLAQFKNKPRATTAGKAQEKRKLGFKDFTLRLSNKSAFEQVFPPDEVAEAALLLMDLSCGRFVYI